MSVEPQLIAGWVEDSTPNATGVRTFVRSSTRCGALQFSWWDMRGRNGPPRTEEALCALAASFGEEQFSCGPPRSLSSGQCASGCYGTAVFSAPPDKSHGEIWVSFDGDDIVLATYMSAQPPDPLELDEAHQMISSVIRVKQSGSRTGGAQHSDIEIRS
jgi:hypothetical protein